MCKLLSQAMTSTIARFAFSLSSLVDKNLIGIAAKGNFVHQLWEAIVLLQSHMSISWFVLNSAPSVNHFTLVIDVFDSDMKNIFVLGAHYTHKKIVCSRKALGLGKSQLRGLTLDVDGWH